MKTNNRQTLTTEDSFYLAEGDLFEYPGEDGILLFYYISVVWVDSAGVERINKNFAEFGYNARNDAEAFVDRVRAHGSVNPAQWDLLNPEPSLEDRLGAYGIEWQREQDERLHA